MRRRHAITGLLVLYILCSGAESADDGPARQDVVIWGGGFRHGEAGADRDRGGPASTPRLRGGKAPAPAQASLLSVSRAAVGAGLGAYDEVAAMNALFYSAAAYCEPSAVQAWDCTPCQKASDSFALTVYGYNASTDVAFLLGRERASGRTVLAFRGTEPSSLRNWADNLRFSRHTGFDQCGDCKVHSGFWGAYTSLQVLILEGLDRMARADAAADAAAAAGGLRIHVTGHSLGAAMAALAAHDLVSRQFQVEAVLTFGQPRVGNTAFAASYARVVETAAALGSFRLTHHRDLVVHLPPTTIGDWHHVGTEVFYHGDGASGGVVCDGSGEDKTCSDQYSFATSIQDHLHYLGAPVSRMCG